MVLDEQQRKTMCDRLYGAEHCLEVFGTESPTVEQVVEWYESWSMNYHLLYGPGSRNEVMRMLREFHKEQGVSKLFVKTAPSYGGENLIIFYHEEDYVLFKLLYT